MLCNIIGTSENGWEQKYVPCSISLHHIRLSRVHRLTVSKEATFEATPSGPATMTKGSITRSMIKKRVAVGVS